MSTGLSQQVAPSNDIVSFLNDLNELAALKQQETQVATQFAASNPRDVLSTETITFPNGMKRPATDGELMAAARTFNDMPNAKMQGMSALGDILGNVPFMRDIANAPVSMAAYVAARRITNGPDDAIVKLAAPQMTKGAAFALIDNARRQIEQTEGGIKRFYENLGLPQPAAQFVSGVHQQGIGNLEFLPVVLSSAAVSKGLAAGARKAGQNAVADLLEMEAKKAFQQGAGTLAKQQAATFGANVVNAALNPLSAPRETLQRITPHGVEQAPTGEFLPSGGEDIRMAFPKAVVSQAIEMQSEGLGELMGPALGAALRRSGLSAKAVAAVPEFVKRWAASPGIKSIQSLATGMKSNIPGFHGVPQEYFEERIGEVWKFASGVEKDAGITGKALQGDIAGATEQSAQELAAFGIMGGVNRGMGMMKSRQSPTERIDVDNLANWMANNHQRARALLDLPSSPSRTQWASVVEAMPELADLDVRSSSDRTEVMRKIRQAYDIADARLGAMARDQAQALDEEWESQERQRAAEALISGSQTPPTIVGQPPVQELESLQSRQGIYTPSDVVAQQQVGPTTWTETAEQAQPSSQQQIPRGFTTARGSTYAINTDGGTTRNRAGDLTHTAGPQPPSEKTYYIDSDKADAYGAIVATQGGSKWQIIEKDGFIAVQYLDGPDKGKIVPNTITKLHEGPAVGITPLETWKGGRSGHVGTPITSVSYQPQPQEPANAARQVQGQPQGRPEGQVAEPPQQQPEQPVQQQLPADQQPALQMTPEVATEFERAWNARDASGMHIVLNNKAARQEFERRTGVSVALQPSARAASIKDGFAKIGSQEQSTTTKRQPDLSDLEPDEQVKVRDRLSKGVPLAKAKEDVKHMRASSVPWSMEVMDKLAGMGMPKAMQTEFVMKAQKGVQEWGTDWKEKRDALEAEYIAKIPQGVQPTFVNDVANAAQHAIIRLEEAGASDDVMKEFASRATQIVATSKQDAKDKVAALEAEFSQQPQAPKIGQKGVTKAPEAATQIDQADKVAQRGTQETLPPSPPKKVGLRGQTAIPGMEGEAEEAERVESESAVRLRHARALRDVFGAPFAERANDSLKAFAKAVRDDKAVTEVNQAMDVLEDIDAWDTPREATEAYRDAAREVAADAIERNTPDVTEHVKSRLPKALDTDEPTFALRQAMKEVIADLVPPDVYKTASADIRDAGDTAEDIVGAAIDAVKYEGYRQKGAVEALTEFVPVAKKMLDDANAEIARKEDEEAAREQEQAEVDARAEKVRQEKQRAEQEKSERQQPPPAPETEQKESANPWVGAPVEQETRWYGTRVRVSPGQRRYVGSYEGTVQRVLNGGAVVEVKPDGTDSTFREKTELVTVLDLKDNGAAVSANIAPDAIRMSKSGEVETPGLLPELAPHLSARLKAWWGKGYSSSYAVLIDSQRAVIDAVETKAKEAPQLPDVDVEAEDVAYREAQKAENEASSKYWNIHSRYEQFVTQKKQTIAANLGVPKQSKAAKWANAWAHAERQARDLPEAKSLAEQESAAEKARNDAKAKFDEATRKRERAEAKKHHDALGHVPEGTVLISGGNANLAIQVGKYDPETGLYKTQSGATDSKGVFYKDGSSARDFSPRMLSNYVTVEQDATLTALRDQAVQVQGELKQWRQDKAAKEEKEKRRKQVEAESDNVMPNYDGVKISVARALPDRLQPEDTNVITDGKWIAKADALPNAVVTKLNARKPGGTRGEGLPRKSTTDELWNGMVENATEEPTFLGVWNRGEENGVLTLFRKEDGSVIAFDADIIGYLTKEADIDSIRVGRAGNNSVDHAVAYRGKKPVAIVMGMENDNDDLLDWDRVQGRIGKAQDSMPIGFVGKNRGVKKPRKPKGGSSQQVLGRSMDTPPQTMADKVKKPEPQVGTELQRLEDPSQPPTQAPPRPVDIIESVRELFGSAIEPGRMWKKNAAGEFVIRPEAIHLAKGHEANIVVAGHELAHRIDKQQNVIHDGLPNPLKYALSQVDYAPEQHAAQMMKGGDPLLSVREGFAEYVRHRLQGTTQPAARQALVANNTITQGYANALGVIDTWFENEWLPQHPDIAKRLATITKGVDQYIAVGPQHRILAGTAGVKGVRPTLVTLREYPDVGVARVEDAMTSFRADWVQEWEYLDRYEKEVVKRGGKLPEDNLSALQFARSLDNASSLAKAFVEDGVRTWDGQTVLHKGLPDAFRRHGFKTSAEIDEWEAYHIARRVMAIHKTKPEYRSSADIRDMEAMVNRIEADPVKKKRYESMTDDYTAFNNAVLDWAVEMGLVEPAAAERMKKSHGGVYMYMAREQRRRGKPSSFTPNVGMGIIPLHNPFRRLKQGSQMPFYRPVEAALLKTFETISNAFQKQVVVQMYNAQKKAQGMGAWIEDVPAGNKATRVKLDDLLSQLVDSGVVSKNDANVMRAVAAVTRGDLYSKAEKTIKRIEATIKRELGVDSAEFDDTKDYVAAVREAAKEAGIANIDDVLTTWTPNYAMSRKEGVFSFKDDTGVMRTVRVHPEIFNSLVMSRAFGTQNAFGKLINVFGGMISRGAVRYNTAFPSGNFVRDYGTQMAQANEQTFAQTLVSPIRGVIQMTLDALRQHGIIASERDIMTELYVEKGSAEWYAMNASPVGLHGLRRHVLKKGGVSQPDNIGDLVRGGLKAITDVFTLGEAAVRRGEFVASLNNQGYYVVNNKWHERADDGTLQPLPDGATPPEPAIAKAALAARDVTVDFQTKGRIVKRMPMVLGTFFSAKVQSLDRMYQQIKRAFAHPDPAVRQKAMKRLAAFAALQAALQTLIWYFTHDEDWYKADRENHNVYRYFQLGPTLRVPKGYEWSIFANVTEAALNASFDKEPENTKKAVERFLTERSELGEFAYATAESVSPLSLPPKVPIVEDMPLVSTLYQISTNKDWRGKPIVTQDLKDLEKSEQYRDTTPQVYRSIGKSFDASPLKVEYFADSVTGGMTRRATRAATKLGEGDVVGAATEGVASGFVMQRESSRATADYFEALEKATARVTTAKRRKQADPEAQDALDMLNAYSDVLKAIRKVSRDAPTEDAKTALWHMEIGTARDAIGKSPLARYKSAMSPDANLPPAVKEVRDQELLRQMRKIAASKPVSVTALERKEGLTLAEKQAEWARDKKVAAQILKGAGWSWQTLAPVWRAGTERTETDGTKQSRIRVAVDLGSQ